MRTCHSGETSNETEQIVCHFSGTPFSPLARPWFSWIRCTRSGVQNPSRFATSSKYSRKYGSSVPSITRLNHRRLNSGSHPPDVSAIIERVPVGATVVTYEFRTFFPAFQCWEPSHAGYGPRSSASFALSSYPTSSTNFITRFPHATPSGLSYGT